MGKGIKIFKKGAKNLGDGLVGLVGGAAHAVGSTARVVGQGISRLFEGIEKRLEGNNTSYTDQRTGYVAGGKLVKRLTRKVTEARGEYVNIPYKQFRKLLLLKLQQQKEVLADYSLSQKKRQNIRIPREELALALEELCYREHNPIKKIAYEAAAIIFVLILFSMLIPRNILGNAIGISNTFLDFRSPLLFILLIIIVTLKLMSQNQ